MATIGYAGHATRSFRITHGSTTGRTRPGGTGSHIRQEEDEMEEQGEYKGANTYSTADAVSSESHFGNDYPGRITPVKKPLKDIADREPEPFYDPYIGLHLDGCPDLLKWLYEKAKAEFREVDQQILYILDQWMRTVING